jgi:hypothetical protein
MEEEDFSYPIPFWCFNLQAFEALKGKSNPNQVIQNAAYVIEEEDFPYPTPFFLQSANNPSPKRQKQPKTSSFKMHLQPFFFYHTLSIYVAFWNTIAEETRLLYVKS